MLALFGAAHLLNFLGYLRERLRWSLLWSFVLLLSLTGLLYILDQGGTRGNLHVNIGTLSAGGWLGYLSYGQTQNLSFGFSLLGPLGAVIVYATLALISLLFLTNFQLGKWIRLLLQKKSADAAVEEPQSADEAALERRAHELERQAKKLKEEVARSGLGADMQPVPEPTVRDLSVPQAKPTTSPASAKPPCPVRPKNRNRSAKEAEPSPAPEPVTAATTEEILGRKPEAGEEPVETKTEAPAAEKTESEKPAAVEKAEPVVHIADGSVPAAKPKPAPKNGSRSPSPPPPSSAITSCRRSISSSTRI